MEISENDFLEIIQNFDDPNVNRLGANSFDNMVTSAEDPKVQKNFRKLILPLIDERLFDLNEKTINGLILFLYQTKITDNEIIMTLNNKSELNIILYPKLAALILRFVGSLDNALLNKELILNSLIQAVDFWLGIDLLFRINELRSLRDKLKQHFSSGAEDYHLLMQRINYWKSNTTSPIIDSILNDIYSFLSVIDKKIMTNLIDNTLQVETKINRFDGIDFISANYKTYVAKIM
jgi:hypothetical protein